MEKTGDKKARAVFNRIIEEIRSNNYKEGDILPSEAELSKKFEVGRGSIREATQVLEILGVVRKQAGIGTVVEKFSINSVFNPAGLHFELDHSNLIQVLEFREIFEEIIIKMLLKKISKEDLEKIEEILALNKFYFERNNYEKYSEYDYKFHKALACATNNIVIENIFNLIFPFLRYMAVENVKNPERLNETLKDHFEIVESIKKKDMKKAKKTISRHIKHVRDFL